ncbi:MAG: cystathionine beta-lyase [Gammaproteobacteria bacterium]|nr:cystathionine beta-lyase [Gammaproteobacteria bacterium]
MSAPRDRVDPAPRSGREPSERLDWRTRLIRAGAGAPGTFRSLAPPIHRGSTVLFENFASVADDWRPSSGYAYGLYGTPTTRELGARLADLEGARHTFVTPSGQAAIALVYLAYARSGAHVLLPQNAYGSGAELAQDLLSGLGIRVETYAAGIGAGIAAAIREDTALVWCESPGSVTMEIEDVPAIVRAAHARGVPVAIDNTYSAGVLFDAFAHGVDVSIQALTKFVGGHSDLLLGSVSVADAAGFERVGRAFAQLGLNASPDDCALALRGLQTLAVRLEALERNALEVARWLRARPEVEQVLHPALPECPGHEIWKRDFGGSSSVFSIVLRPEWSPERIARWLDALRLFGIGFSWGGTASLAMAYPRLTRLDGGRGPRLVRLNVGLEAPVDLLADLAQAFQAA